VLFILEDDMKKEYCFLVRTTKPKPMGKQDLLIISCFPSREAKNYFTGVIV